MKITFLLCCFLSFSALSSAKSLSPIDVPDSLMKKLKSFEPSAGTYIAEKNQYLISSDDTTESDDPWLFLMSEDGEVEKTPIALEGIKKMTDMESMSQSADGSIFILSSQGLNKNGKDKKERNMFVKAKWSSSSSLKVVESIELRPLLLKALQTSNDPILSKMRNKYETQLDVESHFIMDGEMYIGLKEPQVKPSQAVVVRLGRVSDVFAGKVKPSVWRVLDLQTNNGTHNLLSDMVWRGKDLLVTSTSANGEGHLWVATGTPRRLADFDDVHPEGIILKNNGKGLLIFDQGVQGNGLFLHLN